ncbi:MAG: ABC transporter substrate-binding protein [Desulfatibacillaceae bacterium]
MCKRSVIVLATILAVSVWGGAAADERAAKTPDRPAGVVERLHDCLLDVMRNAGALGFSGRYERLEPVVAGTYDFQTIPRVVAGSRYRNAPEPVQKRFVEAFADLSTATYAARFDGYGGERFETLSVEDARAGRKLVRTQIVRPNQKPVSLDYLVHETDAGWRVINVIAEGVSDLSLKRADYSAYLENHTLEELAAELRKKAASLAPP